MHKDKAWHFHFLISGIDDSNIVYTGKVGKGKYIMSELKVELVGFTWKKIYAHEKYNVGYSEGSRIEDSKKASNYITKYITKDLFKLTGGDKRVRRYWNSLNLIKPTKEEKHLAQEVFEQYNMHLEEEGSHKTKSVLKYGLVNELGEEIP